MGMTSERASATLIIMLLIWTAIMGASVLGYALTEPSGDGFTRGLSRMMTFLGWQLAAMVIALICLFLRPRVARGRPLRWIALGPALVAGAQIVAFVAMFLAASAGVL